MNRCKWVGLSALVAVPVWGGTPTNPNILFCIADDASMRSFGAYGGAMCQTPVFDRLAREGALFRNAYSCNPKCAPARACLLTGRYSWQLKEACNHYPHFPAEFTFYPHLLMEQGFHVGLTGKGWGPGTYDTEHNPAGPEYNQITLIPPYKGIHDTDYAANFSSFLDEKPEQAPFCFWLGCYEPHRQYELDSWKKAGLTLAQADVPSYFPDNDQIRGDLLDYTVEINWFDLQLGRAIEVLEERGLLENTLIIITSDQGMPFPRAKGQIYEEGYHVPMAAYWKGVIQPGRVIDDFINFPDVAPTLMELVGLPKHEQMTGRSFLDVLLSSKSGQVDPSRNHVLLGKERHDIGRANAEGTNLAYPVRAIRTPDFLYVHNLKSDRWPAGNPELGLKNCADCPTKDYFVTLRPGDPDYPLYELSFGMRPDEELYQVSKDADCLNNLATHPEYQSVIKKLRAQMETELTEQQDPRMLGTGDVFDRYPYMGKQMDYETGQMIQPEKKHK